MNDISPTKPGKSPTKPGAGIAPRFVSGSILSHILLMTGTGALGLMAIFVGDLANILFLSRLNDVDILAAVGYASTVLFLATSIGIGLSIATTAMVSPAVGARDLDRARRLATNALIFTALAGTLVALVLWPLVVPLLRWIGATGRTHVLATRYLYILLPSIPLLAIGMATGGVLRSLGDPRRSMNVTLAGAIVNVVLDPILIFSAGLGLDGAAIASFIARVVFATVGLWGVIGVHKLSDRPDRAAFLADAPEIARLVLPAVLTNLATPVANAYTTAAIAHFGDPAVAAWAVVGRVNAVAFGAIFALSGSIGPIIGQNLGAKAFDRCRLTLTQALQVSAVITFVAWLLLALAAPLLVRAFDVHGETARLVLFSCRWVAPMFAFLGALFVANALFNTVGTPHYATVFNWGRATLGTVPFVWAGSSMLGADGAFIGSLAGALPFGVIAVMFAYREIDRLARA